MYFIKKDVKCGKCNQCPHKNYLYLIVKLMSGKRKMYYISRAEKVTPARFAKVAVKIMRDNNGMDMWSVKGTELLDTLMIKWLQWVRSGRSGAIALP